MYKRQIDEKDYEAFEYLTQQGIDIQFQLLPDDEVKPWKVMKEKYDSIK